MISRLDEWVGVVDYAGSHEIQLFKKRHTCGHILIPIMRGLHGDYAGKPRQVSAPTTILTYQGGFDEKGPFFVWTFKFRLESRRAFSTD